MAKSKPPVSKSAENGTMKEQALQRIRSDLFTGKFKPGSLISATGLADELPFSRTPIREAMEVLAVEGLIEWVGVSGAIIRTVRPDDLVEIMTLRYAIETQVTQKLAREQDGYKISVLEDLLARMKQKRGAAVKGGDAAIQEFHDLDIEFHQTMARLAGMPRAETFIRNLMDHFRLFGLEKNRFKPNDVYDEHKAIVQSIKEFPGQGPGAVRKAVKDHVRMITRRWAPEVVPWIEALE